MKKISFFSLLFLLLLPLLFSGCLKENTAPPYQMTLEVWGVFDDSDAFTEINTLYGELNPQIEEIKYKKISSKTENYESDLIDVLASGKGPDIIFFKNTWLPKHQSKIAPLPNSNENLSTFKTNFVDVATEDFINENQIYAMPLYCDTLALYYNKDIFNQAGIVSPPKTWDEIEELAKKLTQIDNFGNINQSTIALGRSKDPGGINRSSDILMLMMMQNGSMMYNKEGNRVALDQSTTGAMENPGLQGLKQYTSYAQGKSEHYTWNSKMDYSIDSFRFGKLAMMMGYSYMAPTLKRLDPKLNFDVAPAPQISPDNKVAYPNYWGLAVVQNKILPLTTENEPTTHTNDQRIAEAWKYIQFVTTKNNLVGLEFDPTEKYLEQTSKPAARRDLVEKQKTDPFWEVFANQSLFAKNWYQPNDTAVDTIFVDMIDDVVSGQATAKQAISTASSRIDVLKR